MDPSKIINRTMDRKDLRSEKAELIVKELNRLVKELKDERLKASSWYGVFDLDGRPGSIERRNRGFDYEGLEGAVDDKNFPWFLYWEIVWVVLHGGFEPCSKVLDLGGSSSLFSYYLASKGVNVTTVDLQKELVDNANLVSEKMGWDLENHQMDIKELKLEKDFHHITSICVFEHLPIYDRVDVTGKIKEHLIEGGRFSLTFDYRNPSRWAGINSPGDVSEQFIEPSGLRVRGNEEFLDNGKDYLRHPFSYELKLGGSRIRLYRGVKNHFKLRMASGEANDYTFGALFLENPGDR